MRTGLGVKAATTRGCDGRVLHAQKLGYSGDFATFTYCGAEPDYKRLGIGTPT